MRKAIALVSSMPLLLLTTLLLTTLAHAQSATEAVRNFGLLGTWAAECTQSPSPHNEHSVFSLTTFGTVQVRNDFGLDYDEMVYHVINARPIDAQRLALRQVLTTDMLVVLDVVMLKVEDKVRVWSSRGADGRALVRDGAIASGGGGPQTRWVVRCQGRWADDVPPAPDKVNARRLRAERTQPLQ